MTSENESNVEVKNEGAQKEVSAKKDMNEVRESRKAKAEGKRRGRKASGSNSTTNITNATTVKIATKKQQQVSKRLLTRLSKHESALQEISSRIKLLNSKRFRKKLDSIDTLIKEVKVLDRRLKKVEKVIGRLKRR
jgi:hypothetical protein